MKFVAIIRITRMPWIDSQIGIINSYEKKNRNQNRLDVFDRHDNFHHGFVDAGGGLHVKRIMN